MSGGQGNASIGFGSAIGGGSLNQAGGTESTIGGGDNNSSFGSHATVPGGEYNSAPGNFSFAAGYNAHAHNPGSFAWAGGTDSSWGYGSTLDNSFNVYAAGGASFDYGGQDTSTNGRGLRWVYIGSANAGETISTYTGAYLSDRGIWQNASDKNRKTGFIQAPVRDLLEKVAALPISVWRYTNEASGTRHVGPTAQDFQATFGLGTDDKSIGTLDADGVALAAIQGLNQKVNEKDARIDALEQELSRLKEAVAKLSKQ